MRSINNGLTFHIKTDASKSFRSCVLLAKLQVLNSNEHAALELDSTVAKSEIEQKRKRERETLTTIYFAFSFIFIRLFLFFSFRWHVIRLTVLRYIHTFIQTVSFSLMPRFSSLTYWTYNRLNQHEQHLTYTHHSSHFNHTLAIYFYSNGIFPSHSISFNLSAAAK